MVRLAFKAGSGYKFLINSWNILTSCIKDMHGLQHHTEEVVE